MKTILFPSKSEWVKYTQRPKANQLDLQETLEKVFKAVKKDGDKAVRAYTKLFDKVDVAETRVKEQLLRNAAKALSPGLQNAIKMAAHNIEQFHKAQVESNKVITTAKGVLCWRESRAIERVGIYIPGGSAPLFSTVLMLGIPARLAGCKEIVLCTPPDKDGNIHPAIAFAANLVGISKVYSIGGMQAIAAMTYGTATVPQVDKLFGPGNQYVTAAKQWATQQGVAIDMPAGPSEVLVIADKHCPAAFVAADLLAQAEHGPDSQVVLLSTDAKQVEVILSEVAKQLSTLPRKKIAAQALKHSRALVFKTVKDCFSFSNAYAPEHLILALKDAHSFLPLIENAGSVFIGNYSCESLGDYASGTNHTLPTNGYARQYSGVSLDSFVKKITFQEVSTVGIKNIGPAVALMAEAEQLHGHKNAVDIRLKSLS